MSFYEEGLGQRMPLYRAKKPWAPAVVKIGEALLTKDDIDRIEAKRKYEGRPECNDLLLKWIPKQLNNPPVPSIFIKVRVFRPYLGERPPWKLVVLDPAHVQLVRKFVKAKTKGIWRPL